jgi:hypothetical protein
LVGISALCGGGSGHCGTCGWLAWSYFASEDVPDDVFICLTAALLVLRAHAWAIRRRHTCATSTSRDGYDSRGRMPGRCAEDQDTPRRAHTTHPARVRQTKTGESAPDAVVLRLVACVRAPDRTATIALGDVLDGVKEGVERKRGHCRFTRIACMCQLNAGVHMVCAFAPHVHAHARRVSSQHDASSSSTSLRSRSTRHP